jgi:radical SAM superfamily enzyme YgiQ (UPF0313 family)
MPRLLLINPSNAHKGLGNIRSTAFPPLSLPYLAALTPKHYQIEMIDENIEPFEYRDADIVAITAYTATVFRGYQIAGLYREKGIPTVMGGIHVSMMPDEALRYCDCVAIGEAETIWPEILMDFESGKLKKQYMGQKTDLSTLPFPRRDTLKNNFYRSGSIQTSRGCPMNCTFCSVSAFNGLDYRRRPLESVLDELEQIPQKTVLIADDNIAGYKKQDLEWIHDFFESVLNRKIKKNFIAQASIQFGENDQLLKLASAAGLKILFVGMESLNVKSLRSYGKQININRLKQNRYKELVKKIRTAGILFMGAFLVGNDDEDLSVFQSTLDFVKSTHIDILQVTKLTPLPGTQFWNTIHQQNRMHDLKYPEAWEDFRFSRVLFEPANMSIEDIYEGYAYLKNRYFSAWETFKRTLFTLSSTRSLPLTLLAYQFNSSYKIAFRNSANYHYAKKSGLKKKFNHKSKTL